MIGNKSGALSRSIMRQTTKKHFVDSDESEEEEPFFAKGIMHNTIHNIYDDFSFEMEADGVDEDTNSSDDSDIDDSQHPGA